MFPGEVGAGSAAVAVAAAQAAIATLPMQHGRRGTETLKAAYAAALGKILEIYLQQWQHHKTVGSLSEKLCRCPENVKFQPHDSGVLHSY